MTCVVSVPYDKCHFVSLLTTRPWRKEGGLWTNKVPRGADCGCSFHNETVKWRLLVEKADGATELGTYTWELCQDLTISTREQELDD